MEILGGQEGMYDNALMGILHSCGKLQPFLDSIFSFLARRTDFYIIMQHDRAKMGFFPGVAESMVMTAFKKYEILTRKREAEIMREEETKRIEQMTHGSKLSSKPPHDELPISLPAHPESAVEVSSKEPPSTVTDTPPPSSDATALEQPPSQPAEEGKEEGGDETPKPSEEGVGGVKRKERTDAFNLSSDTYNGAVMENYKWSQTVTDIDVRVPVPEGTKSKHVRVDIRNDHLKVVLLRPERKVIIDKPLLHRVKVEESMWSIETDNGCCIYINLEKTKEVMWKSVLEGEEGIDLTKVDTTRNISEFDEEAQAAIQRVTYDHHMKMLGKPTSNEKKAHDILKKAWNAEGSPFKGTPFDPSKVQIAGMW